MAISLKCLTCGDIIKSTYRHDFKTCTCWSQSEQKIKKAAKAILAKFNLKDSPDSTTKWSVEAILTEEFGTGVAIDGGDAYTRMLYNKNSFYEIIEGD